MKPTENTSRDRGSLDRAKEADAPDTTLVDLGRVSRETKGGFFGGPETVWPFQQEP